jgi:PAS domain S-box-containing protein
MLHSPRPLAPDRAAADHAVRITWLAGIGLAVAVGIACFLAARLSLALLRAPAGVAVFWPALGLAAGTIIALGRPARLPAAVGILAATLLANLAGDRTLPAAMVFAACNAGAALLIGWLVERHHGRGFSLDSLPRVLGFFLATAAANAISGIAGAAAFALFQGSEVTPPATWLHWVVATTLGVVAVAPLVIGIVRSLQEGAPTSSELLEGACILAVLAFASMLGFSRPTQDWFTIVPFAMLLPLLIWPAARCPPVFAAAAVFILALVIFTSITLGMGRLGDASVPLSNRLIAAQAALLAVSTCTLVVAALFAERRSRETLLSASNERLRTQREAFCRLLGSLPAAIYTTDKAGRIIYCNQAAVDLWQRRPALGQDRWSDLWRLHYPDGTSMPLDDRPTQIVLSQGRAVRGREALLERPDGTLVPIMPCPAPLLDEQGTIIGVVNMQVDLTERKQAEAALAERDALLTLASKVARVGGFTLDCATGVVSLSPGCTALYGLPGDTAEMSRDSYRARVLAEDLPRLDAQFAQACAEGQREPVARFRFARLGDGEIRWIETRSLISYDDGRPVRIVGIGIDVTECRRSEEHQRMLIAELDHRVKNVLATVSAVASRTQDESLTVADFAATLAGRIRSMAATHELLSCGQWKGVSVRELVERELAPYATSTNTRLDGPELTLSPEAAQAVSMVLHELTTNAAKHGALSTDDGLVAVRWSRGRGRVRIEWQEAGGPPVRAPERCGYGTDVIRHLVPYELDGSVDLEFAPQGVRCNIEIPVAELNGAHRPDDDFDGPIERTQHTELRETLDTHPS